MSAVRIADFDVVQVTQMSASCTAACTLDTAVTAQIVVDAAAAKASARA